jgi:hypothetical protein
MSSIENNKDESSSEKKNLIRQSKIRFGMAVREGRVPQRNGHPPFLFKKKQFYFSCLLIVSILFCISMNLYFLFYIF